MLRSPVVVFAARAAVFVALQCGICAALVPLAFRHERGGYLAAAIDKHARLEATRGERRLIEAGGSAAAFGFDSAAVERATGRKATNLALHAALGLPFILAEAESAAGPGDVVWLAPEFHFYWIDPALSEEMWACLVARPAGLLDLRYVPVKTLLDHGPFQFAGHVVRMAVKGLRTGAASPDGLYTRRSFDEHGDFVAHVGRPRPRPLDLSAIPSPLPEAKLRRALATLELVVGGIEAKGAEARIVLPALHEEVVRGLGGRVERVGEELQRRFPGRVIGDVGLVPGPDADFFDTPLHLTREAATARTKRLLEAAGAGGEQAAPGEAGR
jgi:hypothetical protein